MSDYQVKFQQLLRELFQFDCADLDFGIYRIMNHKREVIERFITQELPKAIATELERGALGEESQAVQELAQIAHQIRDALGARALDAGGNLAQSYHGTPLGKRYLEWQAKAAGAHNRQALEAIIYNHLYAFFSRYYQDGDFISKRRYSKRTRYAIPYNGEEVILYWANHDQYYIKSAEYFTDYTFVSRGATVHFKLQAAEVEQDNVKGEKRFFLPRCKEITWDENTNELVIPFEYRPLSAQEEIAYGQKNQQEAILIGAVNEILRRLAKIPLALAVLTAERRTDAQGNPVSYLVHHLRQYTRRNTADFFIHKDLQGFLSRELDFYLKNEVLNLDEMETAGEGLAESWFQILRLIKAVGNPIIAFLAQIENFQKTLWEKCKFVTETFYCITLGQISEDLYPEIAACEAQWEEWKALFDIDDEQRDLFATAKGTKDRRAMFLRAHSTLVLDTRHFDHDFVDRLLASFDDLDEWTDGLLVHGENWQALNLLLEKYRDKVKCIYIDPPYNTAASAIPYKNDYKHASFASMMADRVERLWHNLRDDGAIFVSIDKTERTILEYVLNEHFGPSNRVEELIWSMNTNNSQAPNYSTNHEYVLVYAKDREAVEANPEMFREPKPGCDKVLALVAELNNRYPPLEELERQIRELYNRHREEYRADVEAQGLDWNEEQRNDPWRGIYNYRRSEYRDAEGRFVPEVEALARQAVIWVWREGDISMPATKQAPSTRDPNHHNYRYYRPLHPGTGRPCPHPKRGWNCPYNSKGAGRSFVALDRDHRIVWGEDESKVAQIKRFLHEAETNVGKSVFVDYSDGEKETSALFGRSGVFLAPKHSRFVERFVRHSGSKEAIVLDCFGGSGSTAHAVVSLNREDSGRRKFILVEMAGYFDTVLLPRIKKVTFTPEWKDGQPGRPASFQEAERGPRIMKVIRLESYEDALNNITFDEPSGQQALQFEDYLLQYMLRWETRHSETLLNVEKLARPFTYKLHIHRDSETRVQAVDIPETFAYLLGLHVQTRRVDHDGDRHYLVYRGLVDGRQIAVIWRETEGWAQADYQRDRQFVLEHKLTDGADEAYVNGDSFIPGAKALEPLFKARMFAGMEA